MNKFKTTCIRSANFPLQHKSRQGNPLSLVFFDIAIETLVHAVRQNTLISGILDGESNRKMTLYADDIGR